MNIYGKLAAAGLALALSAGAQAAILTYNYTAVVNRVTEYDEETDTYSWLAESSFMGSRVALGDVIHGSLRYDTMAPKTDYRPEDQPGREAAMYASTAAESLTYRFSGTGLAFDSTASIFSMTSVSNSPALPGGISSDYFAKIFTVIDSTYLRSADLFLWNADGTAFNDTSLPQQLDAALFQSISLSGSFMHLASNDSLMFGAQVTSFQLVPADVPEPASLLLLGLGAAGLAGARRRLPA